MAFEGSDVLAIAERVNARLAHGPWDTAALQSSDPNPDADLDTAAEVAVFALELAGKRRQARRGGRFGRLIVNFAFAACVALSTFAAACDKPDATPEETQTAIDELPAYSGSVAAIGQPARASPANFTGMVLMDAGSDSQPWAVLQASDSSNPILVDRVGSGLDTVGDTYSLAAQPIMVGTRDGASQFLDPLKPAVDSGGTPASVANTAEQLEQRWSQDERYLAPTRAISGQTTVLDAAYNAAAAAAAGGTHTYLNGVVLRVEPDKPVLSVIDKALLESGAPTREEDVVYVAIPPSAQSSYNPGQVVNLHNVVMNQQQTDVNGQSTTLYTVDAAVNGAQVEPTGTVDLQSLLQPRLQRVDQDIAANDQAAGTGTPGAPATPGLTPTPGPGPTQPPQQVIVRDRGPSVIINNPPTSISRPSDSTYYSPPPVPSSSSPSTVGASQAASRSTALEASRSAVSGQASGTGGGVAATNKSAAASSVAVGAATAKAASVAGDVSTSSAGKSAASVAGGSAGSSIASRSAGTTSAGTRGSAGVSSSSGGSSSGGLSSSSSSGRSSSGGFGSSSGGKGISGASSS